MHTAPAETEKGRLRNSRAWHDWRKRPLGWLEITRGHLSKVAKARCLWQQRFIQLHCMQSYHPGCEPWPSCRLHEARRQQLFKHVASTGSSRGCGQGLERSDYGVPRPFQIAEPGQAAAEIQRCAVGCTCKRVGVGQGCANPTAPRAKHAELWQRDRRMLRSQVICSACKVVW